MIEIRKTRRSQLTCSRPRKIHSSQTGPSTATLTNIIAPFEQPFESLEPPELPRTDAIPRSETLGMMAAQTSLIASVGGVPDHEGDPSRAERCSASATSRHPRICEIGERHQEQQKSVKLIARNNNEPNGWLRLPRRISLQPLGRVEGRMGAAEGEQYPLHRSAGAAARRAGGDRKGGRRRPSPLPREKSEPGPPIRSTRRSGAAASGRMSPHAGDARKATRAGTAKTIRTGTGDGGVRNEGRSNFVVPPIHFIDPLRPLS